MLLPKSSKYHCSDTVRWGSRASRHTYRSALVVFVCGYSQRVLGAIMCHCGYVTASRGERHISASRQRACCEVHFGWDTNAYLRPFIFSWYDKSPQTPYPKLVLRDLIPSILKMVWQIERRRHRPLSVSLYLPSVRVIMEFETTTHVFLTIPSGLSMTVSNSAFRGGDDDRTG